MVRHSSELYLAVEFKDTSAYFGRVLASEFNNLQKVVRIHVFQGVEDISLYLFIGPVKII